MKNSGPLRRSRKKAAKPAPSSHGGAAGVLLAAAALAVISAAAAWFHLANGYTLYYGDAQAHLAIARRVLDSRTPGAFQIGTVWLPLPHLAMLPFVSNDAYWRSGLAGAIPSAAAFVVAGAFLWAAARRLFHSGVAAWAALLAFALNPNLLYLQSAPMTESYLFAALMALLYAAVWYRQSGKTAAILLAAAASNAASLTRYEGWFLIPFVALYFAYARREDRFRAACLFAMLAMLAPIAWIAHNLWWYSDPLEFYRGEWSAKAIYQRSLDQGMEKYPGDHNWWKALTQFREAARLTAGNVLWYLGLAGVVAAVIKRAWWAAALLAIPPLFYVLSIYSSGTPIYVPHLWPSSYYNTRYGLAMLPLLALGIGALAALAPFRLRGAVGAALVVAVSVPWLAYPRPDAWICWKESEVNSNARRAWTREAAQYLKAYYRPGDGVFSSFSDVVGIYREAGIPLREVLHQGNEVAWDGAAARPDLLLHEGWAVAIAGDPVSSALQSRRGGRRYKCVKMVSIKDAPVIEIYRRTNEDSFHKSARREE